MSRSNYSDDCENVGLWRQAVERAIHGKRGQKFLRELAEAMDAMPEKRLIRHELVSSQGECCTIGVVCKARGLNISTVDEEDPESVGKLVGISHAMAAEIEYENDERGGDRWDWVNGSCTPRPPETPEQLWQRMRKWVQEQLAQPEELKPHE